MAMIDDILQQLQVDAEATFASLRAQLAKLRTGRASIGLLDGVRVVYYGQPTPLNQVAALAVADARMLTVRPYERRVIGDIEKAIMASDIGIMPQNDGELIRLPIPPLNEERRRDMVKQSKQRGEDARIALRNHRRDANEMLKELEKGKDISQDELKRALDKVQEQTDRSSEKVDEILASKEKEILEI
jgi:ribosome recycling factor